MNKCIISLIVVFFFTGCAPKLPDYAQLDIGVSQQTGKVFRPGTTGVLQGHDARFESDIIFFRIKDDPEIRIPSKEAPHAILTEKIAAGLRQQGLVFENGAPVQLRLEVVDLRAIVTKPDLLYETEALSRVSMSVRNGRDTLTKTYKREADNKTLTRPEVSELENLLSGQLTNIVENILEDEDIRKLINR